MRNALLDYNQNVVNEILERYSDLAPTIQRTVDLFAVIY